MSPEFYLAFNLTYILTLFETFWHSIWHLIDKCGYHSIIKYFKFRFHYKWYCRYGNSLAPSILYPPEPWASPAASLDGLCHGKYHGAMGEDPSFGKFPCEDGSNPTHHWCCEPWDSVRLWSLILKHVLLLLSVYISNIVGYIPIVSPSSSCFHWSIRRIRPSCANLTVTI